jgi:stage II sporulation protein D
VYILKYDFLHYPEKNMISINKEPSISVGILSGKEIKFELHGEFVFNGNNQTLSGVFTAKIVDNKIVVKRGDEKFESGAEFILEPQDFRVESFLIKDVIIGVEFHWERKEKQRFRGALKLRKEGENISAINILPIEDYLTSVVSSEMSAKSSIQLLKAHAIISRSWLLAQIEKSNYIKTGQEKYVTVYETEKERIKWYDREDHSNFDVCADDHCQRYQGITKVFTEGANEAVKQTRGIVLTSDDKLCDARYSKSCGGISESFENVWEPLKYNYLQSVVDYKFEPEGYNTDFSKESNAEKWIKGNPTAYCNTTDKKVLAQILLDYDQETKDFYRWKVEYTQEQLSSLIARKSGIDFGDILDLTPIERGLSARLIRLKITGSKKTLIIGKELEIRRVLSESHLYSSAFVVEKKDVEGGIPKKFVLYGAGWGHGVGLCQIGAAVMASKGHQFDEILLHYFRNAKLQKIY